MLDSFRHPEATQLREHLRSVPALQRAERCAHCQGPKPCQIGCPEGVDVAYLVHRVADAVSQGLLPADWFATEPDYADAYVSECIWRSFNAA